MFREYKVKLVYHNKNYSLPKRRCYRYRGIFFRDLRPIKKSKRIIS